MRVTASALDRVLRCPGSLSLPQAEQPPDDAALAGEWRHRYMEAVATKGLAAAIELVPDPYRDLCLALPVEELPILTPEVAFAWSPGTGRSRILGRGIDRDYAGAGAREDELCGSADFVGYDPQARRLLVGDWKSMGYAYHARDSYQLRFLALCASGCWPVEEVEVRIYRLGDEGRVAATRAVYHVAELDEFAVELRRVWADPPRTWSEGRHCRYCPSWAWCPPKTRLALQVATGEAVAEPLASLPLDPNRAGLVWERIAQAEKLLAHLRKAVIACVKEYGSVPLPNGKSLIETEAEGNTELDGRIVHRAVEERYGRAAADAAVELVATKVRLRDALRAVEDPELKSLAARERAVLGDVAARGGASRPRTRKLVEEDPTWVPPPRRR